MEPYYRYEQRGPWGYVIQYRVNRRRVRFQRRWPFVSVIKTSVWKDAWVKDWHGMTQTLLCFESENEAKEAVAYAEQERQNLTATTPQEKVQAMTDTELNEKLRERGMFTLDQMMGDDVSGLGKFDTHAGVNTFDDLCEWVDKKRKEYTRMRLQYEIGEREDDELYEWVLAHKAAFTVVSKHLRKISAGAKP